MTLLTIFCFLLPLLHLDGTLSADPIGFVSLDCGYTGPDYVDPSTNLTWKPDTSFFDPTGNSANQTSSLIVAVDPPTTDSPRYYRSARYFTGNRTKYCYVFNENNAGVVQGSAYLVRASFWAGKYAVPPTLGIKHGNSTTSFQLYINADYWDDVAIDINETNPASTPLVKEMYVTANYSSELAVCLGGPGVSSLDSPFISSLELRPIPSNTGVGTTMTATSRFLFKLHLINFGSNSTTPLRYPSDIFDRIWEENTEQPRLWTTRTVFDGLYDNPPLEVLQTARATAEGETVLNVTLGISENSLIKRSGIRSYYYSIYMAEITANVTIGQRVFDINVYDGKTSSRSAVAYDIMNKTDNVSFKSTGWYTGGGFLLADAYEQGSVIFSFVRLNGSVFGPQVNGIEFLIASEKEPSAGTLAEDVSALRDIQDYYFQRGGGGVALYSWLGDPCLPYAYNWINCSNDPTPAITALSLANQNLTGGIPFFVANLTSLSTLDLQGNKLNGSIPQLLATLPNLRELWLQNNNFTGVIPTALLEKQSNGLLKINVDGNPFLCNPTCTTPVPPSGSNKSNSKSLVIGIVIGVCVLIAVLVTICLLALSYYMRKNKKRKEDNPDNRNKHGTNVEVALVGDTQLNMATSNKPRAFSYAEVEAITDNFSSLLGKGGFGTVFYGQLDNKVDVAVKILSKSSTQGVKEFLNEVNLLSRVHHRNLVGLLGYCIENQVMLIYEYMPCGSLESLIHGNSSSSYNLSWSHRLRILVDAAQGIDYLHNGCRPKIIHRDLKPANILISEDMEAKISDFGISRSSHDYKDEVPKTVTVVKGSTAYMAPEYLKDGDINEKIDVYAFGIVILEVISGRSPFFYLANGKMQHIKNWVKPLFETGNLMEIIDPKVNVEEYNVSSMWKVLEIAMACIQDDNNSRPTMEEVVGELKNTLSVELEQPIYYTDNYSITSS